MKTNLRSFVFVLLTVSGGMGLLAGNAQAADEVMSPEVKALIGMKIPPKVAGVKQSDIPKFVEISGGAIDKELGHSEGFVDGKWPVFLVSRVHPNMEVEIMDIQMLPPKLISWKLASGKLIFLEGRYKLSDRCRVGEEIIPLVLGLMKQEKGNETCAHYSSRVKMAWKIDQQSGRITPFSTNGLQCYYIAMDNC